MAVSLTARHTSSLQAPAAASVQFAPFLNMRPHSAGLMRGRATGCYILQHQGGERASCRKEKRGGERRARQPEHILGR